MEAKIRSIFNNLLYLIDRKAIAVSLRDLFTSDLNDLKKDSECKVYIDDIDDALKRYFSRREHRYAIRVLDHYIANGNTEMENTCEKLFHQPERFKRIKAVLTELFVDLNLQTESLLQEEFESTEET